MAALQCDTDTETLPFVFWAVVIVKTVRHATVVVVSCRSLALCVAPLRRADDARLLDTTDLDIETAFRAAIAIVEGSQER